MSTVFGGHFQQAKFTAILSVFVFVCVCESLARPIIHCDRIEIALTQLSCFSVENYASFCVAVYFFLEFR